MPDRTGVAVVIPTFNAASWICDALESVVAQDEPDLEVVVVDDGSTDHTRELVAYEYPAIRVIALPHGGVSRTRNVGTGATLSRFIQYLDADDLLGPDKIRRQRLLLESTGADVAYGDWQRLVQQRDGTFRQAEVVARRIEGAAEVALFSTFWCPPAAYLFRRSLVERMGGWNESLPIIQDARFALDCALHGGHFAYAEGVVAAYRVHFAQSLSRRDPRAFLRDCFRNAEQIAAWWNAHGGVTVERRAALLAVYEHVARGSYDQDAGLFEDAHRALERLEPGFVPRGSRGLALLARLLGYERAEAVALLYRRVKPQPETSGA